MLICIILNIAILSVVEYTPLSVVLTSLLFIEASDYFKKKIKGVEILLSTPST
jgi:hypothetical protein